MGREGDNLMKNLSLSLCHLSDCDIFGFFPSVPLQLIHRIFEIRTDLFYNLQLPTDSLIVFVRDVQEFKKNKRFKWLKTMTVSVIFNKLNNMQYKPQIHYLVRCTYQQ